MANLGVSDKFVPQPPLRCKIGSCTMRWERRVWLPRGRGSVGMQILSNTRTTDPRQLGRAGKRPMRPFQAVCKPVHLHRELQCPNVTIQICGGL